MKSRIRKNGLKLGILFLAITALILGIAVPGWADGPTATFRASKTPPPSILHTLEGKVIGVKSIVAGTANITIQNGNQPSANITVDSITQYYTVPLGKAWGDVKERLEDAHETVARDLKEGSKNTITGKPTLGQEIKDLHLTSDWRSDLNFLDHAGKSAQFSDVQVGDRVVARVQTTNGVNLAKQVLIIKAPVIQTIKGIITVSGNSITITPTQGAPVTLSWDGKTQFNLTGLISVQTGQYAVAKYNRITLKALTVNVWLVAPTSTHK